MGLGPTLITPQLLATQALIYTFFKPATLLALMLLLRPNPMETEPGRWKEGMFAFWRSRSQGAFERK